MPKLARAAPAPRSRLNQRERTRQALLDATRALLAEGTVPTIAQAAQQALISEATAYRYYSNPKSLLRDALAVRWPELNGVLAALREIQAVEERAQYAAVARAHAVLANEMEIRALVAMSYAPPPAGGQGNAGAARPEFRVALIETVLESVADRLTADQRRRLQLALSVIVGAEAVLSLKDVCGCSNQEVIAALGWSAFQVTAAALRIKEPVGAGRGELRNGGTPTSGKR